MNELSINQLLADLKNSDQSVRYQATVELWRIWFGQKGVVGLEMLQRTQAMLEVGNFSQAEEVLTQLIADLPDFAEAWNRRAVLYYMVGEYEQAIADCKMVVKLNPVHFGAWHGLGLSFAALGEYSAAIKAFRQALEIQPYAIENQRLILECTARIN